MTREDGPSPFTWASALLLCGAVFVCGRWAEEVVHDLLGAPSAGTDTDGDGDASSDGLDP